MVTGKLKPYEVAIENKRHGKTERNAHIQRENRGKYAQEKKERRKHRKGEME